LLTPQFLTANLDWSASQDSGIDPDTAATAQVRRAWLADASIAGMARSLHVITIRSRTTLRGEIASKAAHDRIVRIARRAAGNRRVDDQLTVPSGSGH
jgi:osmotically-inducible protein OsmY